MKKYFGLLLGLFAVFAMTNTDVSAADCKYTYHSNKETKTSVCVYKVSGGTTTRKINYNNKRQVTRYESKQVTNKGKDILQSIGYNYKKVRGYWSAGAYKDTYIKNKQKQSVRTVKYSAAGHTYYREVLAYGGGKLQVKQVVKKNAKNGRYISDTTWGYDNKRKKKKTFYKDVMTYHNNKKNYFKNNTRVVYDTKGKKVKYYVKKWNKKGKRTSSKVYNRKKAEKILKKSMKSIAKKYRI